MLRSRSVVPKEARRAGGAILNVGLPHIGFVLGRERLESVRVEAGMTGIIEEFHDSGIDLENEARFGALLEFFELLSFGSVHRPKSSSNDVSTPSPCFD